MIGAVHKQRRLNSAIFESLPRLSLLPLLLRLFPKICDWHTQLRQDLNKESEKLHFYKYQKSDFDFLFTVDVDV